MKHKIFAYLLSIVLIMSVLKAPIAYAASDEAVTAADALFELGLFSGTGTDSNGKPIYDLDRTPTRNEAVTMLVRLLGKEEEAKNGTWNIPFTDVAEWAKPYVGYAYVNGLTSGTSATTYEGNALITATQYLTFVLRALGYDSVMDFKWDRAWELTDKIGITNGQYNSTSDFSRGDVALISYKSLFLPVKGTDNTLLEKITSKNESKIPDYKMIKGDSVLSVIPFSSGNAYVVSKNEFGEHKYPYIEALKNNGFELVTYFAEVDGTDYLSDEYYNPTTGERVYFLYEFEDDIVVFISVGRNIIKSDIDSVMAAVRHTASTEMIMSPVKITNMRATMDAVGGWTFTFDLENRSNKTIKYVTPSWYCLNAVGDKVYDEISREDKFTGRITGPIEPGEKMTGLKNNRKFYNFDFANSVSFGEIVLEYMDGSVEIISSDKYYDYWDLK